MTNFTIGPGITLGPGVTLQIPSGGGGGGSAFITATFTDTHVDSKGMGSWGSQGDLSSLGISSFVYSDAGLGQTIIGLIDGTYSGYTIETRFPVRSAFYIGGVLVTSVTVTANGITQTMTFGDAYTIPYSDAFNLQASEGNTISLSISQ